MSRARFIQSGLSLVELVVTIVVLAIAAAAILSVYTNSIVRSADPQLRMQATAVANSYLDEILLRPFADPDGSNAGETRGTYDNVADYNGLSEPPTDQNGTALPGLSAYTVTVAVNSTTDLGIGAGNELRITVNVNHPALGTVSLVGYKANY